MRLIIEPDAESVGEWVAAYICKRINDHQSQTDRPFVLGLPTGSTPLTTYRNLICLHQEGLEINQLLSIFFLEAKNRKFSLNIPNFQISTYF